MRTVTLSFFISAFLCLVGTTKLAAESEFGEEFAQDNIDAAQVNQGVDNGDARRDEPIQKQNLNGPDMSNQVMKARSEGHEDDDLDLTQ